MNSSEIHEPFNEIQLKYKSIYHLINHLISLQEPHKISDCIANANQQNTQIITTELVVMFLFFIPQPQTVLFDFHGIFIIVLCVYFNIYFFLSFIKCPQQSSYHTTI